MKAILILLALITAPARAFDYQALRRLIGEKHLTSVEGVVQNLPADLFANYTLMRQSSSLQGASDRAPRVILFGGDGGLFLAYNGDPALGDHDVLEAIQFHRDTARYDFYRVQLAGHQAVFSPANPPECVTCHTARLRPNWEQYPNWPGAFGAADDFPQGAELTALRDFFALEGSAARYASLTRLPGSDAAPFETKDRGRLRFRPNFRLAVLTFSDQAAAMAATLAAHPRYPELRLLFALSRLQCNPKGLDAGRELERLFGSNAGGALGPWSAPDWKNAYGYLLRDAGISPREFTTRFAALDDKDPYFFHCGLPRELVHDSGGNLELSDFVMARMLEGVPAARPYLKKVRWVEKRFAADAADGPLAASLDDVVGVFDVATLAKGCGDLQAAYEGLNRFSADDSGAARAPVPSASR